MTTRSTTTTINTQPTNVTTTLRSHSYSPHKHHHHYPPPPSHHDTDDIESQTHIRRQSSDSKYTSHHLPLLNRLIRLYTTTHIPYIPSHHQHLTKLLIVITTLLIITVTTATTLYSYTSLPDTADPLDTAFNHSIGPHHIAVYDVDTTHPNPTWSNITALIIVAGHAVLHSIHTDDIYDEHNWYLEDYQYGQLSTYIGHIQAGVELCASDPASLLLYTGGETRINGGVLTEAHSYYIATELLNNTDFHEDSQLRHRILTEEYARDSFENLMYSIARFYEITTHYPQHITVVGFEFKRQRFEQLHRTALRIPESMFTYVGIDQVYASAEQRDAVQHGEQTNSFIPFTADPYGCDVKLHSKKHARNPYRRQAAYVLTNPRLRGLLLHCGPDIYAGPLPWDTGTAIQ